MNFRILLKAILPLSISPVLAWGWTSTGTYQESAHEQLQYVITAPTQPVGGSKWPVVFFEPGDGTDMSQDQFSPAQMGPMMEQLSQAANAVLVVGELRRQLFIGESGQICSLDFNHRVGDLSSLIDQIKMLPFIDSAKIILFAHSAGGETVTKLARSRNDVHGVFTVSTGVVSCSEDERTCPFSVSRMQGLYNYICSSPNDNGREGIWWQQLFQFSNLRSEIENLETSYVALVGSKDTQISLPASQAAGAEISLHKPNFTFQIIQGADHGGALTDPATLQALVEFVNR